MLGRPRYETTEETSTRDYDDVNDDEEDDDARDGWLDEASARVVLLLCGRWNLIVPVADVRRSWRYRFSVFHRDHSLLLKTICTLNNILEKKTACVFVHTARRGDGCNLLTLYPRRAQG